MSEDGMTPKEAKILKTVTKQDCREGCKHCKHTDAHDTKLNFIIRYCMECRLELFRKTEEMRQIEFAEKIKRVNELCTDKFMSTGRVYPTSPKDYEYINLNTGKKFTCLHPKLEDAVQQYLTDDTLRMTTEELLAEDRKREKEKKNKT